MADPGSSSNRLRGLNEEIPGLVWENAPRGQLGQSLRVTLERAGAKYSSSSSSSSSGNALCLKLLQAGADAFVRRDPKLDHSPLIAAAQAGKGLIVSALLENGPDLDGDDWETPMFLSKAIVAAAGNTASAAPLVADAGSTAGGCDNFTTPLHLAASRGQLPMVKALVRAGADTDAEDENGDTPLHLAVFRGFEQVVEELVNAGASVDTVDSEGETPLHTASANGSPGMVKAILRGSRRHTLLCPTGHLEMSPLHRAALGGHCEVMDELLSHGFSIHCLAGNDLTPLHTAAMSRSGDAVRFLLDRDSSGLEAEDREGRTALHLASGHRLGSDGALLALLEAGANIEAQTKIEAQTPLHKACNALRVSAVQQLLRFGANEAAVDAEGRTPAALTSQILQSQIPGMFRDMLQVILGLLATAPADKVWRRRGWLLMLRSRQGEVGGDGNQTAAAEAQRWWHYGWAPSTGVIVGSGACPGKLWMGQRGDMHFSRRPRKMENVGNAVVLALATGATRRDEQDCHPGGCSAGMPIDGSTFHGAGAGDRELRSVVERVIGICEDGVFRNLVAFL